MFFERSTDETAATSHEHDFSVHGAVKVEGEHGVGEVRDLRIRQAIRVHADEKPARAQLVRARISVRVNAQSQSFDRRLVHKVTADDWTIFDPVSGEKFQVRRQALLQIASKHGHEAKPRRVGGRIRGDREAELIVPFVVRPQSSKQALAVFFSVGVHRVQTKKLALPDSPRDFHGAQVVPDVDEHETRIYVRVLFV